MLTFLLVESRWRDCDIQCSSGGVRSSLVVLLVFSLRCSRHPASSWGRKTKGGRTHTLTHTEGVCQPAWFWTGGGLGVRPIDQLMIQQANANNAKAADVNENLNCRNQLWSSLSVCAASPPFPVFWFPLNRLRPLSPNQTAASGSHLLHSQMLL